MMIQHTVVDLLLSELLYAFGGRYVGGFIQKALYDSYTLVWRFTWVRFELQQSPFRYIFL